MWTRYSGDVQQIAFQGDTDILGEIALGEYGDGLFLGEEGQDAKLLSRSNLNPSMTLRASALESASSESALRAPGILCKAVTSARGELLGFARFTRTGRSPVDTLFSKDEADLFARAIEALGPVLENAIALQASSGKGWLCAVENDGLQILPRLASPRLASSPTAPHRLYFFLGRTGWTAFKLSISVQRPMGTRRKRRWTACPPSGLSPRLEGLWP